MRTLMYDSKRELSVVENEELRRYELLLKGTTAGTLDFRVLGGQRVLGHTEVIADHRGRGLGTALIQAVLDDLIAEEVRITNYCPAVERFLQGHPTYLVVLDPSNPAIRPRSTSAPLQQLVHAQHTSLRELAARAQDPDVDGFARRRILDQFTAVAAQHAAAVADVLLPASSATSDVDTAVLVDNLKKFEQALRVLKGRAYGDARFLNLSTAETWRDAERLLTEHESFETDVVSSLEQLHSADVPWTWRGPWRSAVEFGDQTAPQLTACRPRWPDRAPAVADRRLDLGRVGRARASDAAHGARERAFAPHALLAGNRRRRRSHPEPETPREPVKRDGPDRKDHNASDD
ncbi:GNAT family N-acetyltransferase [Kribbella sp. CA-245084]|uniref:GNAT family N-acetyltransferase n=1 Tax=Kribbella sp. CA-245084 TaxID=3239940 RepID=UPI003D8A0135